MWLRSLQRFFRPRIGRIRTGASFCLEVFQQRAVLQPCNTDDAQLRLGTTGWTGCKHRNKNYGKWPFIVDLPIENGDFP